MTDGCMYTRNVCPNVIVKVLDLKDVVEKAVEKQRQRSLHLTAARMRELGLREGCNTLVFRLELVGAG